MTSDHPHEPCESPCPTRAPCPTPPSRCCARRATGSAATPRSSSLTDPDNDVEFFYLRPRDIAVYVGSGTVDVGITGRDLLLDSGADAVEVMTLGFGALDVPVCRARPARRRRVEDIAGKRVATSYPGSSEPYLADARHRRARSCASTAPSRPPSRLGVADAIADVVETGTTLRQQGLEVFGEPILRVRGGADQPRRRARA